jgi:Domain of unknown function (DUF4417)
MMDWGIPSLRADRLSSSIPTQVYARTPVSDPARTLFLWRTASLTEARGMTVAFYVWDDKLEGLWRNPERQKDRLLAAGVAAAIEPDFSLWADMPLVEQLWNVYRARWVGRSWQEAGIPVIPSLNWSDARSYEFCFAGIPRGASVVAVECRTPGQHDNDRRAFLSGLVAGVRQVQPQHVLIYGGREHQHWLTHLPVGPRYTLLESWTHARDRARRHEVLRQQHRQQLVLFPGGDERRWADEAQAEAAAAALR